MFLMMSDVEVGIVAYVIRHFGKHVASQVFGAHVSAEYLQSVDFSKMF